MRLLMWIVTGLIAAVSLGGLQPSRCEGSSKPGEPGKTFTFSKSDLPPVDFSKKKRGVEVEGFLLTASLAQLRVAPNGKVLLHLVLKNKSAKDRVLLQSRPETEYILYIESQSGKPTTIDKTNGPLYWADSKTLKPNEEFAEDFVVSDSYSFSSPGRYRITAARRVPGLNGHSFPYVVSNTVTLTVSKNVKTNPPKPAS